MQIQRLASTDAFIVFDLDGAPSAGITRAAPKILVDGATALARTLTYRFATFERQVSGASAGINTKPDDRAGALAAYVGEVEPLVADGRFLTEPGRGVTADDLAGLLALDPRPADYRRLAISLTAVGVAAAAATAAPGLDGRSVAIEGFDAGGPPLAAAMAARGARIVAISTADGTASTSGGTDPAELAGLWDEHGTGLVRALDAGSTEPAAVFGAEAEVLVVGSKTGVVDEEVASGVRARVVVPSGPIPVTAKGLAVLRRAGVVVVPDFVSTAGPLFAGWPSGGVEADGADPAAEAAVAIADSLAEVVGHPDGPLLAACYRAEAYLGTWRDELPFGRPLA